MTLREALLKRYRLILVRIAMPRPMTSDATQLADFHADAKQMEALLTRLGVNAREVLNGEVPLPPPASEQPEPERRTAKATPLRKKRAWLGTDGWP